MSEPTEIVQALVGLKEVRVLHYRRRGSDMELMIEQVVSAHTMNAGSLAIFSGRRATSSRKSRADRRGATN